MNKFRNKFYYKKINQLKRYKSITYIYLKLSRINQNLIDTYYFAH